MKLKLNPTIRLKRRYLLVEAKNREIVEKAILDYTGVLGWAKAAPFFIDEKAGKLILAVNRGELDSIRGAFELSGIKVIKVSGTIKNLQLK